MKHAKALSQLVQIRGPDRYTNELDITLLKASRGLIVSLNCAAFCSNLIRGRELKNSPTREMYTKS